MPLLGYNFNKPGKGRPGCSKKHPFLLFWELLEEVFQIYHTQLDVLCYTCLLLYLATQVFTAGSLKSSLPEMRR